MSTLVRKNLILPGDSKSGQIMPSKMHLCTLNRWGRMYERFGQNIQQHFTILSQNKLPAFNRLFSYNGYIRFK
jgi:hypothetical protein